MSSRGLVPCARSGALFSALRCGDCRELVMNGAHHCGVQLVAIAERNNGFTLQEAALALGISQPRVRDLEEAAMRKFAERINTVVT